MPKEIFVPEVPDSEDWDPIKEEFIPRKGHKAMTLTVEHSLLSLSKWEAKWHIPFLGKDAKTYEQTLDYIRCMTISPKGLPADFYSNLPRNVIEEVNDYINDSMTATWFREDKNAPKSHEIVTSEVIYFWMVSYQIPFDCEKWHLNRLLTLIRVYNEKNKPPEKMSKSKLMSRNKALNAARKAKLGTRG